MKFLMASVTFNERRKERKKKEKPCQWQFILQTPPCTALSGKRCHDNYNDTVEGFFGYWEAPHALLEGHRCLPCVGYMCQSLFYFSKILKE